MKLQQARPMNEAADRLREWLDVYADEMPATAAKARDELTAALATADRLAVQRTVETIRKGLWFLNPTQQLRAESVFDSITADTAIPNLERGRRLIDDVRADRIHDPSHKDCNCVNCESGPFFR